MCKVNLKNGWSEWVSVFFFFSFFFSKKSFAGIQCKFIQTTKEPFSACATAGHKKWSSLQKLHCICILHSFNLRQPHSSHHNMDRKRVPGPELSVAPLVEYPVDRKCWTPQKDHRHDASRQPEDMRPICMFSFATLPLGHVYAASCVSLNEISISALPCC